MIILVRHGHVVHTASPRDVSDFLFSTRFERGELGLPIDHRRIWWPKIEYSDAQSYGSLVVISCLSLDSCKRRCSVDNNVGMEARICLPLAILLASIHIRVVLYDKPTRCYMNPVTFVLSYLSSEPHVLTYRCSVGNA